MGKQAYHLELLQNYRIHLVFNVTLLESYKEWPGETPRHPPLIRVDEENKWEVEQIVNFKMERGTVKYYMQWKGYKDAYQIWESQKNVNKCETLDTYFQEYSGRPGGLEYWKCDTWNCWKIEMRC